MDTGEAVKKYWPWVLGGVAALYLLSRAQGGSSDSSGGYYQVLAAQSAAAAQNAQVQAQAQAQANQMALQQSQIQMQYDVAMGQRDVALAQTAAAVQKSDNDTAIGFISANAQLALAAGSAASGIISSLNQPAVMAINAMGQENDAALNAAAQTAVGSFLAQASMVNTANKTIASTVSPIALSPWGSSSSNNTFNQAAASSQVAASQSAAQSASAVSGASAQASNGMWNGIGSITTGLLGAL